MDKDIRVICMSENYEFKPFDCGNDDLNGFLLQDYWMMRTSR